MEKVYKETLKIILKNPLSPNIRRFTYSGKTWIQTTYFTFEDKLKIFNPSIFSEAIGMEKCVAQFRDLIELIVTDEVKMVEKGVNLCKFTTPDDALVYADAKYINLFPSERYWYMCNESKYLIYVFNKNNIYDPVAIIASYRLSPSQ